jgi:hypothetical protein
MGPVGRGAARGKLFLPSFRTEHSKPELDEMAANYNTGRTATRPLFVPTEESRRGNSGYLNKTESAREGLVSPLQSLKEIQENHYKVSPSNPAPHRRAMPPLNTTKLAPYSGSPPAINTCPREMSGLKEKERRVAPANFCSNLSKAFGKVSPIDKRADTAWKLTQTQAIKRSCRRQEDDVLVPKFTLRTDGKRSERSKVNKLSVIKNWRGEQSRLSEKDGKRGESRSGSRGGKKRARSSQGKEGKRRLVDEA